MASADETQLTETERNSIISESMTEDMYTTEERKLLSNCTLCPRECGVNRFKGADGYCGMDAGLNITSIVIHRGEEPPISGPEGICNIFFSGCNLKCNYCQNYEISRADSKHGNNEISFSETLKQIENMLSEEVKTVGFVSPSHVLPQVKAIIRGLNSKGLKPTTVYNTNSYDKAETIELLDGFIDVYLPDYKYVKHKTADDYSDAPDYPEIALKALRKMYFQKGSSLMTDEKGRAVQGLLIRHLVLPGHIEESKDVLRMIASELSPGIHLSLMSQYYPVPNVKNHPLLGRSLYKNEYEEVVELMEKLGFRNGWVQDMDSYRNYRPDFSKRDPFG